jgi:hypothetical protein
MDALDSNSMLAAANTSLTPCAHFPRCAHVQLAVAGFQGRPVPCAASFLRLLLAAHFRGARHASFRIEGRKCAEPKRSASLTMNTRHLGVFLGEGRDFWDNTREKNNTF